MKKILSIIICCALVFSFSACTKNEAQTTETTAPTHKIQINVTDDAIAEIEDELSNFEGIVYITHNGELVHSQANGEDEFGNDLTVDSPMYIGSVSKQFCATAIMMLKEQGKLSVDDTLDKYFPEYELGKDITIKNLLTMRSGIHEMLDGVTGHSAEKTESENIAIIKDWVFAQPLDFEPDSKCAYSNTNYFLLSNIVEMVSGEHYNDFIRKNIFEPLNMEHTGFVSEVKDNEFFSKSLTYETFVVGEDADGLCKGAGDIVTTAQDMDKWMTGLVGTKVVSKDSYSEMTENYSPDEATAYGYGLMQMYKKGIGHMGNIGNYTALDYANEKYGLNIFAATTQSREKLTRIPNEVMDIVVIVGDSVS